jgi:heavy metal sensor kinase
LLFRSIRFRLTLWYFLNLVVILAISSTFLFLFIREQLYSGADSSLLMIAESLASPTMEPFREADSSVFDQVLEDFIGEKSADKMVRILDTDGTVKVHAGIPGIAEFRISRNALQTAAAGKIHYETVSGPQHVPYRVVAYPLYHNGRLQRIIQVGVSLREPAHILDKIRVAVIIFVPLGLFILVSGGWFLAGRALKPVDVMTRTIRRMSAENLNNRLRIENPDDEIGRLAATFNDLLVRVDHAVAKIRQFSSNVSHELRTPLTIMRGETEVALRWAKEPDQFREALQSSLEEITRMTGMIEKLLELEKVELGGTLNFETVDLADIVREQAELLERRCANAEISLTISASDGIYVTGDRARLRQVMMNLADNAIKATPPGGTLSLFCVAQANGTAEMTIQDTGSGIPLEHLGKIFDPFYRIDSARNRTDGGTGLGLSLAHALVKAHRGRIDVQSAPGVGSTFRVILPSAAS